MPILKNQKLTKMKKHCVAVLSYSLFLSADPALSSLCIKSALAALTYSIQVRMGVHRLLTWALILILPCLASLSALEEASNSCPEGWMEATHAGMGCLYFNSTTKVMWEEATSYCQSDEMNASLVEIWTELQLDFVISELMFLAQNGIDDDWWIGATDLGREGHWYWANSLATVGDFIWSSAPKHGVNFNCAVLENSLEFLAQQHVCGSSDPAWTICQIK